MRQNPVLFLGIALAIAGDAAFLIDAHVAIVISNVGVIVMLVGMAKAVRNHE